MALAPEEAATGGSFIADQMQSIGPASSMELREDNRDAENPERLTVSVCIPVFNRARMAIAAIQSALAQEVPGLEVVAVDDCSTDGAWEAMNELTDARLRLIRNEANLGLFGNFNRCLDLARGKYLRILCSDDRLVPGGLGREVALMEANPTVVLLSSRGWTVDGHHRRLIRFGDHFPAGIYAGHKAITDILWTWAYYGYNPLNLPSGILLRKKAISKAGGFCEGIPAAGDVDLWLRVLRFGDLAVTTIVASEVLVHEGAEGYRFGLEGQFTLDQLAITRKWADLRPEEGIYAEMLKQIRGCTLWRAIRLLSMRQWKAARIHWNIAFGNGTSYTTVLLAFFRLIKLRLPRELVRYIFGYR